MADQQRSNIILIGMPGSGKSTVGVVLAKQTARHFLDSDLVIQTLQGRSLQEIVDKDGYMALRRIEEQVLVKLTVRNHVIATGGSAIYSDMAMTHLKSDGVVIFLSADLLTLKSRIHNLSSRGLAKPSHQSLDGLFKERLPLYEKYADHIIPCEDTSHEKVCQEIVAKIRH